MRERERERETIRVLLGKSALKEGVNLAGGERTTGRKETPK
jgi:hypothetical protein